MRNSRRNETRPYRRTAGGAAASSSGTGEAFLLIPAARRLEPPAQAAPGGAIRHGWSAATVTCTDGAGAAGRAPTLSPRFHARHLWPLRLQPQPHVRHRDSSCLPDQPDVAVESSLLCWWQPRGAGGCTSLSHDVCCNRGAATASRGILCLAPAPALQVRGRRCGCGRRGAGAQQRLDAGGGCRAAPALPGAGCHPTRGGGPQQGVWEGVGRLLPGHPQVCARAAA